MAPRRFSRWCRGAPRDKVERMTTLHTLRVFLGPNGKGGNPLGVFLDGGDIAPADRQAVAADLGYSETVFVDDRATGELRIFTPAVELPLAGHPLVGTSWLLGVVTLRPPAGEVPTWSDGERTWIRARPEWATLYDLAQLPSVAAVDAFAIPGGDAMVGVWAWEDEAAGRLRARIFPNGIGIDEDEATGAAAIQFGALLGRDVVIRQGEGSELHARPGGDGTVAVGGRVELVSERRYAPAGVA
jgi:predicted PhzF superfamily epimerase YddE/YHI9